jgi:hypothetical protein
MPSKFQFSGFSMLKIAPVERGAVFGFVLMKHHIIIPGTLRIIEPILPIST